VIGNPGEDGSYAPGFEMLRSQIEFSGVNRATGQEVHFSGHVRTVSVSQNYGVTVSTGSSDSSSTNSNSSFGYTSGGITISDDQSSSASGSGSHSETRQFSVTDSNSNYVLEGNWTEGGNTYYLDGVSGVLAGGWFEVTL
jgi:hypothetical protein